MAKRHFDKGVDKLLDPTFAPGERLLAAVQGVNKGFPRKNTSALSPPIVPGGLAGRAARSAIRGAKSSLVPTPAVSDPGTAGTVHLGEVLVALTAFRIWIFPCKGPQVLVPPVVFEPQDLRSLSYVSRLTRLTFEFDDKTTARVFLPSSFNHAEALVKLAKPMIERARPPEVLVPPPASEPPPGDWLASPPRVQQESARFAERGNPPTDPHPRIDPTPGTDPDTDPGTDPGARR